MKKPPKNQPCDNHTGVEYDWSGAPTVIRCRNLATQTHMSVGGPYITTKEMWLCDDCSKGLFQKGVIK